MTSQFQSKRTLKWNFLMVCLALAGLAVFALAVSDGIRLLLLKKDISSADPHVRGKALMHIANERYQRAAGVVYEVLRTEQDRDVLESAGYAAMRIRDNRGIELLRRRADQGPDDAVRAKLIVYTARLAKRDLRLVNWLTRGAESFEPWRRIGSAVGLLELGQPRGGQLIIDYARKAEPAVGQFAIHELKRIAGPMAETVGQTIHEWPGSKEQLSDDVQWSDLEKFWRAHATVRLLNDVLTRIHRRERKWQEVGRLVHAREKFATLF